ncbi:hypothetical protein [Algoriphagus aquimarinus]|uniref:hypothetical protein n=1 Tax=Algoriphagus aquimarinus TaxID=237018 RepID=UPI00111406EF|nr:hypothetical protein [Algoriphagus aquimarinus]
MSQRDNWSVANWNRRQFPRSVGTNGELLLRDVPVERGVFIYSVLLQTNSSYGTVILGILSLNIDD